MPEDPAPAPGPPRRLRIVGVSGAGKTRLARDVAERLRVPHLELDAVFWDAGWAYRDLGEAHAMIDAFVADHPDGWVAEGNWSSRLEGRLDPGTPDGADVLVWLDLPRWLVMVRVVRRTIARGVLRTSLWHGNRERPRDWLRWDPERNIVRWAWVQHPVVRSRMLARMGDTRTTSRGAAPAIVQLGSPRAVRAFVDGLGASRS
ncbi:toxin [Litorihabitans aurantiacus]|uniref:Adenylate kinase n=1 Tax=Litorihabitans aurantiacus TaxID=1930061 RepID=A0AA37XFA5_9MICO|nr:toxin [Litorihabitans aurantiacus]GMA31700.1 hypothetical protein GCM10025875_16920 [Litorihabitans aurantiacus]